MTTVQLEIYAFIQNFWKKVFQGRNNQKQLLNLFWVKEMFLKTAVLKVSRWILKQNPWKIPMKKSFLVRLQNLNLKLYLQRTSSQLFFKDFDSRFQNISLCLLLKNRRRACKFVVSTTILRRGIKIPLCLSSTVRKSLM